MLNVEAKSETLRFLELVITIDADRLSCRLWNSVARNTGSGDTVLVNGTSDAGRRYRHGGEIVLGCWCYPQDRPGMLWWRWHCAIDTRAEATAVRFPRDSTGMTFFPKRKKAIPQWKSMESGLQLAI